MPVITEFYRYLPTRDYICSVTGDMWGASGINAQFGMVGPIKASTWIDQNQAVHQLTWAPGEPELIRDRVLTDGGWVERQDYRIFNQYHGPVINGGDPTRADAWLDHVHKIYPDDAEHIIQWCAHRAQQPGVKLNHALVLGGAFGTGKDALLAPLRHAVGIWNFRECEPVQMMGRFNGFRKAVVLRVSEAHDLGDMNRYQFYDRTKILIAQPPELLPVDEKNVREYPIPNLCGVVITSNHRTDGLYLPAGDRRHYVAWSEIAVTDFVDGYWNKLWGWYEDGGTDHVVALLRSYDLTGFDPNAPPPKTEAFWDIVAANRPTEAAEFADVLDLMGWPDALCMSMLLVRAPDAFRDWLKERKNRKMIPHRLADCGYVQVRNTNADDGLWRVLGSRQMAYAKASLAPRERLKAVESI